MINLLYNNFDVGIAYCDIEHFGEINEIVKMQEYNINDLLRINFMVCTSMFRKKVWEISGGYNSNMVYGYEDWDFWLTCLENGFYGKRISEPLFKYRKRSGSMLSQANKKEKESLAIAFLNHKKLYSDELIRWAKNFLGDKGD